MTLLSICRKHDVWEVRRCEENKHEEEAIVKRGEILHTFDRAREESVTHPGEVEDEEQDEYDHG